MGDGEENKTRKIPKASESRVLPCLAFFIGGALWPKDWAVKFVAKMNDPDRYLHTWLRTSP